MKKSLYSFLVLLILGICSRSHAQEPVVIKLSQSDVETPNAMLSDFATGLSYIPLETHPDGLIGDAVYYRAIHIPGAGYIIYHVNNSQETAMFFSEEGQFKNRIGKIGKGPGEYTEYRNLVYDPYLNQVVVLTYFGIMTYELDGRFKELIEIETGPKELVNFKQIVVADKESWAIYYSIWKSADLKEIGVMKVNKKGKFLKVWDLSDDNYPSTVGRNFSGTYLTNYGGRLYFSHYPGYKIEALNQNDHWDVAYLVEPPFRKTPLEYYTSAVSNEKRSLYEMDHGNLNWSLPYGKHIYIGGAFKRKIFYAYYDTNTGKVLTYTWDSKFNKRGGGISNDIDGGFPIRFGRPDSEGYSYELVGAEPILDFQERGLLKPDGKRYGNHLSLQEAIKNLQPEDNPVLVLIKMKE